MAKQLFANNASSLLAASISDSDLTIQVQVGYGALYPNPGVDEFFAISLENDDGDIEVCYCNARTTDILTVQAAGRGQEGTTAQAWTNGQARVELRVTKGTLDGLLQRSGGEMSGDIDMNDNEIQAARLTGDWVGTDGQLVGTAIRGTEDDGSNELLVPADGSRATAGGAAVLTEDDDLSEIVFAIGMIVLWYGATIDVPTGWKICNGSNGTPDMRDRFPVGAGSSYALGATGGATSNTPDIGLAGGHTPSGSTDATVLTADNMPVHNHELFVWEAGSNGPGQMENFGNSGIGPAQGVAGNKDSNTYAYRNSTVGGNQLIKNAGDADPDGHDHALTMDAVPDHDHTITAVPTLPPYLALHYIMFTGS